jgi:hypothetical protein
VFAATDLSNQRSIAIPKTAQLLLTARSNAPQRRDRAMDWFLDAAATPGG